MNSALNDLNDDDDDEDNDEDDYDNYEVNEVQHHTYNIVSALLTTTIQSIYMYLFAAMMITTI